MSISRITTPPPILPLAPLFPGVKAGQTGQFFQSRQSDLQDLGQSLQSGDVAGAEQDFNSIQSFAQTGPFNGKAFGVNQREQDFSDIGQALQSGDISGAKQDFAQLESTFSHGRILDPSGTTGAKFCFQHGRDIGAQRHGCAAAGSLYQSRQYHFRCFVFIG